MINLAEWLNVAIALIVILVTLGTGFLMFTTTFADYQGPSWISILITGAVSVVFLLSLAVILERVDRIAKDIRKMTIVAEKRIKRIED